MAQILGGGPPVNEAERQAIAYFRDHAPDYWLVLHNIELPVRGGVYEVDLAVVTDHALCLIDVKGVRGRVEVIGGKWYPSRRASYGSPVAKLRGHAKALKGVLERADPALSRVFVDAVVLLTADDAQLIDTNNRPEADANHTATLLDVVRMLQDVSRVRTGFVRDIRPYSEKLVTALTGSVQHPTGPQRFGNWEVVERLGGTDEVTEYRAVNATTRSGDKVRLRVYRADPFLPEAQRAAERLAIANAYEVLTQMPPHECVVGRRDFFAIEDESQFVLVLEDVPGKALRVFPVNHRSALTADAKLRVIGDLLRGLAHAHAYRVIHRALSPDAVLVTGASKALLTGFDYARPEAPRDHTVVNRLAEILDPVYVAPECQERAQAMNRASDVYSAGIIAYQLLTGELPFVSTADQWERGSVLPPEPMANAGLPEPIVELLQKMCARAPSARPSAADAHKALTLARRGRLPSQDSGSNGTPSGGVSSAAGGAGLAPDYDNLPDGYQLTSQYTVQRKLGKGTFGAVYQVFDNLAGTDQAIKIVIRDRDSVVERLRQEYQVLRGLSHPNVVKVEGASYLDGGTYPYLIFEYLDGQEVGTLIKGRPLGPADAVKLAADVARGLVYLHEQGVYHCDIKPRNLMRTDNGCKIIDFNVAVTAGSSLSKAGGTTPYAPPDRPVGPPSTADLVDRDIYSLGVTFYEVLTGLWPFASRGGADIGETPTDPTTLHGLTDLAPELAAAAMKAIAPLRGARFTSAAEFLAALEAIGENVHRRLPLLVPDPRPRPSAHSINPFVDHLKSLYSQSTSSNAGTRSQGAYDLYVATQLDTRLIPDVLAGRYRLVVITGNAGDGKTAFLDNLIKKAEKSGGVRGEPRDNGVDIRLLDGRWLRTNHDGSQDEGETANDEVLLNFFAAFAGDSEEFPDSGETRLIAINEGRLVDFIATHEKAFGRLGQAVRDGLKGDLARDGVAVVNLNQRSVVAVTDEQYGSSIFDRMLARMTDKQFWAECESCELVKTCYAPHNARTLAHPSAGPKVVARLRELYTLTHLQGKLHITIRDLRSTLAYTLTSGRDCAEIHDLYRAGTPEEILSGFYFNSWRGASDTEDRLLTLLREVDVARVPDPALDRRLDYVGPDAGQAVMTVDQRGSYDVELLNALFSRLSRSTTAGARRPSAHMSYLASARRRFFFECVDDLRSERMLPYRSAGRFLSLLENPAQVAVHLPELVAAINRGEGLSDPRQLGDDLALQIRKVVGGTIRSYRLFRASTLSLSAYGATGSPYLEQQPDGLVLRFEDGDHSAELRIQLDLFELLHRLQGGYLPGVAEQQGLYLGLTIFKNQLSATPYQEVVLTTGGQDLRKVSRESSNRLVMQVIPMRSAAGRGEDDA
ncbi:methylation-associated defense system protein kinase MAD6 [Nonomuraea sp. KM90]|uniref:methylation-associated defense system protein kinase MAD6 n=1 Tax=Nonomuraea sp. KM90 TaxID=3457428 RepID=UPI003FCE718D